MPTSGKNGEELDKKLEYFDTLKNKREKWNAVWDELKKYVCPQTETNKDIFDSAPIWAREQLASGLQSMMTDPDIKLDTGEENAVDNEAGVQDQEIKEKMILYSQIARSRIRDVLNHPESNFSNQKHEFILNVVGAGTSIFYVEEDPNLPSLLFFRNINYRECYFEDNRYGFVDRLYRLFNMPIKVAAQQWPDNKELVEKALKTPDEQIEILHIVAPAENNKKKQPSKNTNYDSLYIYLQDRTILSEGSYDYFPFLVTRWKKEEGDPYGYAPGLHVLPDIKLLNRLRQNTLKTAQKLLEPPLLVPKDGYHLPLHTTPGSVNFYRPGVADEIKPVSTIGNPMSNENDQAQCREAIYKAFHVDIFRMQKENKEMTATEVAVRNEEQMRMMTPMMGRIETEFLNPLINIVYRTLLKYNRLPELRELGNTEIRPIYVSPLTRAQKASSLLAIEQTVQFFQNSGMANMFPDIYDNMNWDKAFRQYCELKGVPQEIMAADNEVAQIRQQRKKQQEQMQ